MQTNYSFISRLAVLLIKQLLLYFRHNPKNLEQSSCLDVDDEGDDGHARLALEYPGIEKFVSLDKVAPLCLSHCLIPAATNQMLNAYIEAGQRYLKQVIIVSSSSSWMTLSAQRDSITASQEMLKKFMLLEYSSARRQTLAALHDDLAEWDDFELADYHEMFIVACRLNDEDALTLLLARLDDIPFAIFIKGFLMATEVQWDHGVLLMAKRFQAYRIGPTLLAKILLKYRPTKLFSEYARISMIEPPDKWPTKLLGALEYLLMACLVTNNDALTLLLVHDRPLSTGFWDCSSNLAIQAIQDSTGIDWHELKLESFKALQGTSTTSIATAAMARAICQLSQWTKVQACNAMQQESSTTIKSASINNNMTQQDLHDDVTMEELHDASKDSGTVLSSMTEDTERLVVLNKTPPPLALSGSIPEKHSHADAVVEKGWGPVSLLVVTNSQAEEVFNLHVDSKGSKASACGSAPSSSSETKAPQIDVSFPLNEVGDGRESSALDLITSQEQTQAGRPCSEASCKGMGADCLPQMMPKCWTGTDRPQPSQLFEKILDCITELALSEEKLAQGIKYCNVLAGQMDVKASRLLSRKMSILCSSRILKIIVDQEGTRLVFLVLSCIHSPAGLTNVLRDLFALCYRHQDNRTAFYYSIIEELSRNERFSCALGSICVQQLKFCLAQKAYEMATAIWPWVGSESLEEHLEDMLPLELTSAMPFELFENLCWHIVVVQMPAASCLTFLTRVQQILEELCGTKVRPSYNVILKLQTLREMLEINWQQLMQEYQKTGQDEQHFLGVFEAVCLLLEAVCV